MRCGLYGKLPSKRDFVSIAVPRHFLDIWEPWLGPCLAQSRATIDETLWREIFCDAPAWRFCLETRRSSTSILLGTFVPSVDAIGRYFPLTLVAQKDVQPGFTPSDLDACEIWFETAEELLLSIVDGNLSREAVDAGLANLNVLDVHPSKVAPAAGHVTFIDLQNGNSAAQPLAGIFAPNGNGVQPASAALNYWWTHGSETYRPHAFVQQNMPDATHFMAMLAERFIYGSPETRQE